MQVLSARRLAVFTVVALGCAFAWTMQGAGAPQNSNYALVRALADGTAQIDRTRLEVGQAGTNDVITYNGHVFSNKAPGLALLTLPVFVLADAAGVLAQSDPVRALWLLTFFGAVLPATALLALLRQFVERVEPGLGTPVAGTLGAATLVLPFASAFFSHVLAALLLFGAFVLLARPPDAPHPLAAVALAGLLAGLAVVVEYQSVLAAPALGLYALRGRQLPARAASFVAAWLVGIVPLLVYNQWAFGSFRQLSYGLQAGERYSGSLQFIGVPSLRQALELLFSTNGLLVLMPVLACALAGVGFAYRRGHRAEALVGGGIFLAYFVYDTGFYSPFGGLGPPRFFVPVLPFLALPLAATFRRFRLTTIVATLLSATMMIAVTATYVLASYDHQWFSRLARGDVPLTVASVAGVTGWYAIVPFVVAAAAGLGASLASTTLSYTRRDAWTAAALAWAWAFVSAAAPQPVDIGGTAGDYAAYWAPALLAAGGVAALLSWRVLARPVSRGRRAVAPR